MPHARPLALLTIGLAGLVLSDLPHASERLEHATARAESMTHVAESMLTDIQEATWIRDGQSKRVMYVFFDPNCPYCRKVYDALRPQVDFGEVELRWIPIGTLMATSLGKAAAMLEAKDPTAALRLNEERFTTESGGFGGIAEEPAPRADTRRRLDRNVALLRRSGRNWVPSVLYRDKQGQAHFIFGAPSAEQLVQIVTTLE